MSLKRAAYWFKKERPVLIGFDFPLPFKDPNNWRREIYQRALEHWLEQHVKPGMLVGLEAPSQTDTLYPLTPALETVRQKIITLGGHVISLESKKFKTQYFLRKQMDNVAQWVEKSNTGNPHATQVYEQINKLIKSGVEPNPAELEYLRTIKSARFVATRLKKHQPAIAIVSSFTATQIANQVPQYRLKWFGKPGLLTRISIRSNAQKLKHEQIKRLAQRLAQRRK